MTRMLTEKGKCDTCGGRTKWSDLMGKPVHVYLDDWQSPTPHEVLRLADQAEMCARCLAGDHSAHQGRYGGICIGCSCPVIVE